MTAFPRFPRPTAYRVPLVAHCLTGLALLMFVGGVNGAPVPPAAELLPPDTLALLSIPDWDKAAAQWKSSPQGKLWNDPAVKAFKENLLKRWQEDFAGPLEKELDAKLTDYADLLRGQMTLAVIDNGWSTRKDVEPGVVLLIDTKDKQDALKTRLEGLKKKWVDAGRPLKSDKVHNVELTTLVMKPDPSKSKKQPDDNDDDSEEKEADSKPKEITFGQAGGLFIAGTQVKDLERLLSRHSGGMAPVLSEQAAYESNRARMFRDALMFGWVNFDRFYQAIERQLKPGGKAAAGNPLAPRTDRILAATGLNGLKTVAGRLTSNDEGSAVELFLAAPESQRQGVFKLLPAEKKEAAPPAFVGADVLKFSRWRVDGQKAWTAIEGILKNVSPELSGLLQMSLQAAGKDKDPNFDLRKALIGNLGDDFISVQKAPRSGNLAELTSPPALLLVGSPNADQLVQGLKALTGLMPLLGGEPKVNEREFLGRKIYSLALPSGPEGDDEPGASKAGPRSFSFVASGRYAALSADSALVEEYVRSAESPAKPLRDVTGLSEAAQKVGGMNTGLFGYQNQAEGMRIWLESAKKQSAALDKLLSLAPIPGGKESDDGEAKKGAKNWIDVSLLPPFEQISKYFHFVVYALDANDEGLNWKVFAPTPPRVR